MEILFLRATQTALFIAFVNKLEIYNEFNKLSFS